MSRADDPAGLFTRATEVFDDRVRQVPPDRWGAPTPCDDWDVRALVNHVAVEDLWAPQLLAGRTMDEVGDAFDGDQLGTDPVAAWTDAVQAARQAVSEPDVASRTVHLSYGDESAAQYLMQLFTDHLVHAWDLAQATGGDTRLPDDLVTACSTWFAEVEQMYRTAGVIGPAAATPPDADAQARLLGAFGRDAATSPTVVDNGPGEGPP
jgi:uncharacterized protein (TIGR03086 family)